MNPSKKNIIKSEWANAKTTPPAAPYAHPNSKPILSDQPVSLTNTPLSKKTGAVSQKDSGTLSKDKVSSFRPGDRVGCQTRW